MIDLSRSAVILVASRPESLQIVVERLGPKVLGLILSQEILIELAAKCRELEDTGVEFLFRIVDSPMEIGDAFNRFEHLLSELLNKGYGKDDVLLDVTGGTTPMRLGVALAAMTHDIPMVHQRVPQRYANGRWERDHSKEVEVAPMGNPLESTGLLREGQAVQLFNRRDYDAAALVFEDVARKVTGVERRHYYGGLLLLAEGYGAWDVADYGGALGKLRAARAELSMGFGEPTLAERADAIVGRIAHNLGFLGNVQGKKPTVEKVVDMVENARRRIEDQRRFDDGVARLYRAVEMWHQWRLQKRYSVSADKVDWAHVGEQTGQRFLDAAGLAQLPVMLDLTRARTLDRFLSGDGLEEDNVFRDLLQQRNRSILAHGLKPIEEAPARRFLEYIDDMVDRPQLRSAAEHARLREI